MLIMYAVKTLLMYVRPLVFLYYYNAVSFDWLVLSVFPKQVANFHLNLCIILAFS